MAKQRLDIAMVLRGLIESRERAKALIMSGIVYVDNDKADKSGQNIGENNIIEIRGETMPYVSRGGYKLEKSIKEFNIDLSGKICMDVGASTGGFTDCMLQNGAKKVYSVDVGYGQLAWKLRQDERVVNMERTNIRYVEQVEDKLEFVSIDVSFISLKLVLPAVAKFLAYKAEVVALIKPQFEAGREQVGKKGVVRDKNVHIEVVENIYNIAISNGFTPVNLSFSPIKGPQGNREYLIYLTNYEQTPFDRQEINKIVEQSHVEL